MSRVKSELRPTYITTTDALAQWRWVTEADLAQAVADGHARLTQKGRKTYLDEDGFESLDALNAQRDEWMAPAAQAVGQYHVAGIMATAALVRVEADATEAAAAGEAARAGYLAHMLRALRGSTYRFVSEPVRGWLITQGDGAQRLMTLEELGLHHG